MRHSLGCHHQEIEAEVQREGGAPRVVAAAGELASWVLGLWASSPFSLGLQQQQEQGEEQQQQEQEEEQLQQV
jgi:hypothetical protein